MTGIMGIWPTIHGVTEGCVGSIDGTAVVVIGTDTFGQPLFGDLVVL